MRRRVALLLLAALLPAATPAWAHEARPIYLQVQEQAAGDFLVQVKAPPSLPVQPDIVMADGCRALGPALRLRQRDALLTRQRYRCEGGIAGGRLGLDYGGAAPAATALVQVDLANGVHYTHLLPAGERSWTLPQSETAGAVAVGYARLGVEHIWLGLDHLLFVACLLFIARTPRRLLLTVTGFTVAHSLTLALSILGWVQLPAVPVEAAIALSIVFLACEIARPRTESWTWRYPVLVSSLFGLLHGFGFAAVLREIGLPQTQLPMALLSFNVGVEIGQLLFVAACLLLWAAVRRVPVPQHTLVPAYGVGSLAGFWFIDRVSGFFA